MYITKDLIGFNATQAEVDYIINHMVLSASDFSEIACLDGRMSGVITDCDTCDYEFNECLRKSLISALISVQKTTESELGYDLTPRYYAETVRVDHNGSYALKHPGIAQVGILEAIASLEGTYAVDPFLIPSVTVEDSGNGMCYAVVPTSLVSNPKKLDFWDDTDANVSIQAWQGYPKRVGENWHIALGGRVPAPACDVPIKAFHCEYTILDTPLLECESGTVTPVYVGTTQRINQYKPMELTEDGMRWFLPIEALLDPAFIDENANLSLGEFWKLIPEISFACFEEATSPVKMHYEQSCDCAVASEYDDEEDPRFTVTISDAARGLVVINDCSFSTECCKQVKELTVYYKTDPSALGIDVDLGGIRQAMSYYVAAILPLGSCGCKTTDGAHGFIETAQQPYTDVRINPVTGETFVSLKFGNLYGQLVYTETIGRMPKFKRGFVL